MTDCSICGDPYTRKVNLGSAGTFHTADAEKVCYSSRYDRLYFHENRKV
ncbi:hypothetical protein M199_gp238 [Halogranum tailed virus 1]|uniref:Uncharacterized protein n=1 Tax=Halogranum tailed virus 1 TaxID=1273749 RepID=R4TMN7_9CAUD|nr:hypothetical protein M199_gp238 [Halogranum tailed virus 1]AGM11428.1 hypothetical protein HGTV1_130 [Halogranum tailed virus 1]